MAAQQRPAGQFEHNVMLDPQQLTSLQKWNQRGGIHPRYGIPNESFVRGLRGDKIPGLDQVNKAAEEAKAKEALTGLMANLSNFLAGRGTTAQNMAANRGYSLSPTGDVMLQQATQKPMPFDQSMASAKNLLGIVQSIGPTMYNSNEQVREQIEKATPEVARALGYKMQLGPKYSQGVPTSFYENRFNIYLQRRRENNLYAFI